MVPFGREGVSPSEAWVVSHFGPSGSRDGRWKPAIVFDWLRAPLWREGVPPSIAPQGAQNTRRTRKMRALAGAVEGGTPSLQSATRHALCKSN